MSYAYSVEDYNECPMPPLWKIILTIIVLAFCVAGVMAEEPDELLPGGVTVGLSDDGKTPIFMVDIFSVNWKDPRIAKKRWYAKPAATLGVMGSNTKENMTTHPGKWISTGAITALLATKGGEKIVDDVSELFSGENKDDDKAVSVDPEPAKPAPAVQVNGQGNSVTVPSDNVNGSIVVGGVNNTVNVTEPAWQTKAARRHRK